MARQRFSVSPLILLHSIVWYRRLIFSLTLRDLTQRYKSSLLGQLWVGLNPLIQLALYWFVFSTISKSKWDGSDGAGDLPFGLIIFPGLVAFTLISEGLVRGPALVTSNISYVKKLIFPLEVIPMVNAAAGAVVAAAGLVIVVLVTLAVRKSLFWAILLLPLPLAALVICTMGISWLLAAVGVFFRDIGQITASLGTVVLFTAPIVYPIGMLPEAARTYVLFNPLTIPTQAIRALLFAGAYDDWTSLGIYTAIVSVFAWLSFALFQRLRTGFADVL